MQLLEVQLHRSCVGLQRASSSRCVECGVRVSLHVENRLWDFGGRKWFSNEALVVFQQELLC